MIQSSVLVLNRSYMPVHITSLKHALCLVYRGLAKVVDEQYGLHDFKSWSELSVSVHQEKIGLVNKAIRIPRVVLLHFYDRMPSRPVRFSRINVYLRDRHTCQYCGKHFATIGLNLDHVIPLSQGGKTTWENVVCSCIPCNLKKGGHSPEQAGMKLVKHPVKPQWSLLFRLFSGHTRYDEWKPFLNMVDFSYWNVELQD